MTIDSPDIKGFLIELYTMTEGNTEKQVSMYDVGERLGMERNTTSAMSEDLIIDQLVELKTLSGGIGITAEGLTALQKEGLISTAPRKNTLQLGKRPVLDANDRDIIDQLLLRIKNASYGDQAQYAHLEELVVDMKTIETQLLSPKPKTAIIIETLRSLSGALKQSGSTGLAGEIEQMLQS